ncbi:MAG: leucine-rich repeat protein [Bacteroidales bacterium]|nr:leucine-rich repeat protein [Bacteroidales bacterium]
MKRIIYIVLLLLNIIAVSCTNNNNTFTIGDLTYEIMDNDEVCLLRCNNTTATAINIPPKVMYKNKEYNVKHIYFEVFKGCSKLTSVTFPNTITHLDMWIFKNCTNLTTFNIPPSVREIYRYIFDTTAFYKNKDNWTGKALYKDGCLLAVDTTISGEYTVLEGTRLISDEAFWNCKRLTSIIIPDGVSEIGSSFSYCTNLTSIRLPNGISRIKYGSFSACNKLDSVNIPSSVTYIGDFAFSGCKSLTSINIPEGVTSIESNTFNSCDKLVSINLPSSITHIGARAFYACDSLSDFTIPSSVKTIGNQAFENTAFFNNKNNWTDNVLYKDGCLLAVDSAIRGDYSIVEGTRLIAEKAFRGCEGLQSIVVPNSINNIPPEAFMFCSSLTSVSLPNSIDSIQYQTFFGCSSLKSIKIPDSIVSIEYSAFYNCNNLERFNIPSTVEHLGGEVFYNTAFYNNKDNWEGDVLYKDDCLLVADTLLRGAYTVKEKTRLIADRAFDYCKELTSISIPNSVAHIGFGAFSDCSALTSIVIPHSVRIIENITFYKCKSLTSIVISSSITNIVNCAFDGCNNIKTVTCLATEPPKFTLFLEIFRIESVFPYPNDITLLVPKGCKDKYINSDWNKYFDGRIKEME